jgi:CheY-like chemotaxis protein
MMSGLREGQAALQGRRVLVVEDEFMLAEELRDLIERLGGQVVGPVASTKAALDLLETGAPHMALLDVNLRGERVYALAAALEKAKVPFIFTTGYDVGLIDERFRDAPHLGKPFSPDALLAVVRRLPIPH